jgi:hypothetical protein
MSTARQLEWFKVDIPEDPTPGDVDQIRWMASDYRSVHSRMVETVSSLRSLDRGAMKGLAIEAVDERVQTVADLLDKVKGRYDAAASALDSFAGTLEELQAENAVLVRDAVALVDQKREAEASAGKAASKKDRLVREAADESDIDEAQRDSEAAWGQVDGLSTEIAAKRAAILDTGDKADVAQRQAADQLESAMDADGLTDSLGARFWATIVDIARSVSEALGKVAVWLSVAAMLLSWVPVLGQFLVAADLIVNGALLICDAILLAAGEKKLSEVIVGVLSMATMGAGRVATKAFKTVKKGVGDLGELKVIEKPNIRKPRRNTRRAERSVKKGNDQERRRVKNQERYNADLRRGGKSGLGDSVGTGLKGAKGELKGAWCHEVGAGFKGVKDMLTGKTHVDWGDVKNAWTSHKESFKMGPLPDYLDAGARGRARSWEQIRIGTEYVAPGALTIADAALEYGGS